MSIRVMSDVWSYSQAESSELLLLLAIADFADEKGVAYPAIETLAKKCRQSKRATSYQIVSLQKLGELKVQSNKGRGKRNVFQVMVKENMQKLHVLRKENMQSGVSENMQFPTQNMQQVACSSINPSCINHHEYTHHELIPADAGKNGVSVKFQIPNLIEFSEQYLDPKLEAWLEKNAPAIPPHSTTSEFLQYHFDNKTEFQSKQHFIKAWRGWMQNAQKFVITRSKNKANRQKGNNRNGSNDKHPSRQPEPDLSFLREAGLL